MPDKFAHLAKVKKNIKDLKKIINSVQVEHSKAFLKAADEHLKDEEGQIDYSRLEEKGIQRKYADTMADHYRDKVMKKFNIKDLNEFDENSLLHGFYGITRQELRAHVVKHGEGFSHDKYIGELAPQIIEELRARLTPVTFSHLKDEHIKDIVDYTKTGKIIDPEKMTLADAVDVLMKYHAYGAVTKEMMPKKAPYLRKKEK